METCKYEKLTPNMSRRSFWYFRNFRIGIIFKAIWYLIIALMVTEFLVLNSVVFYTVSLISKELSQIKSPYKDVSFFEKLQNNENLRKIFNTGKDGGFVSIIQETIERLYLIHEEQEKPSRWTDRRGKHMKAISFIGLDVSHSGESSYIYRKIFSRKAFPYHFLIIDIGANDGFVSSNSFNFIQWGWDAILVEPQPDQIKMAKKNIYRYIDPGRDPPQMVHFVQAVISDEEGHVQFVLKANTYGTESHIYQEGQTLGKEDRLISVPSMRVQSLNKTYHIPEKFGILSIDAEGFGASILYQWINAGFTPAYIIFERIHQQESIKLTTNFLSKHDYQYIETRGWNMIFEHQP